MVTFLNGRLCLSFKNMRLHYVVCAKNIVTIMGSIANMNGEVFVTTNEQENLQLHFI